MSLALVLAGQATAKPPEEDAIERAERAAERAAKAAERAAESAERAAERGERDRDAARGGDSKDAERDREVKLASNDDTGGKGSDGRGKESPETAEADSDREPETSNQDDPESNSGSGSGGGDDEEVEDNSGHGSGDDDDDDDDDADDDDEGRQKQGVIVPVESDATGNPFREGELVIMSDDAGLVARAETLGFGVVESHQLESIGSIVVRLRRPDGISSAEALEMLRSREPASPSGFNYIYRATGDVPDQPPQQDDPAPVKGAGAIRVGVIDGFASDRIGAWPVQRLVDHPALKGHGDAVANILLRDLAAAYRMTPHNLILLDVMRQHGGGGAADVSALVLAFDRLVTARVDMANLSLAGPDHPALRRAVEQSLKAGMAIVAAVGNEGPAAPPAFPAAYEGVVGVAAVDNAGRPYLYSGRGAHVDIAALGVEISSSASGKELVGTSYAAPHVTAMLAGSRAMRSQSSIDAVLAAYSEDAGVPGRDPIYGMGILRLTPEVRLAQTAPSGASRDE